MSKQSEATRALQLKGPDDMQPIDDWLEELDKNQDASDASLTKMVERYRREILLTPRWDVKYLHELMLCRYARELIDAAKDWQHHVDVAFTMQEKLDNLRALLRRMEWSDYGHCYKHSVDVESVSHETCPICDGCNKSGHASDCELAAVLAKEKPE